MTIATFKGLVDVSGGTFTGAGGSAIDTSLRNLATLAEVQGSSHACDGRLTLTTGLPVTTADVVGVTNVYLAPTFGNVVKLYDGSRFVSYNFAQMTLALGVMTAALPHDIFCFNNTGTLTLEKLAWTNTTTRATALVSQGGIMCKTGALERLFVGTLFSTSTTTTEDSLDKRLVWNEYNAVERPLLVAETTTSWTYGSPTWRAANASNANRVQIMVGRARDAIALDLYALLQIPDTTAFQVGIGEDTTTSVDAAFLGRYGPGGTPPGEVQLATAGGSLCKIAAAGYRFYQWVESAEVGTGTVYGLSAATPPRYKSGIVGRCRA